MENNKSLIKILRMKLQQMTEENEQLRQELMMLRSRL